MLKFALGLFVSCAFSLIEAKAQVFPQNNAEAEILFEKAEPVSKQQLTGWFSGRCYAKTPSNQDKWPGQASLLAGLNKNEKFYLERLLKEIEIPADFFDKAVPDMEKWIDANLLEFKDNFTEVTETGAGYLQNKTSRTNGFKTFSATQEFRQLNKLVLLKIKTLPDSSVNETRYCFYHIKLK